MLSFFRVMEVEEKGFHIGIFFDVAKEFQQKESDGIVCKPQGLVFMSNDGPDK